MAIKHATIKAPGQPLAAVADWNANHTIDANTITAAQTQFADQDLKIASSPTFSGLTITNNIIVGGNVDGVDISDFKTTYDAHNHSVGDPTKVDHVDLLNKGVNTHPQIDTHITTYGTHDHSAGDPTQVSHDDLTDVTANQHHAKQHALSSAADHTGTITLTQHGDLSGDALTKHKWTQISNKPATFPPSAHGLVSASHTAAGLTIGHVVRATGAAAFAWAQLQHSDLGGVTSDLHHAQAHTLASHSTKAHTELTGVTSDLHHAQAHTLASHSTKAHAELTNVTSDQHHPQLHNAASHTDIASTGAQIDDAVAKKHDRQHSLVSAADHTSAVAINKHFKADANGLPIEATNTDAEISAAVTASHARQHALNSAADHTGTITDAQHGVRTLANAHAHGHLSGIGANDHHAQAHTIVSHDTTATGAELDTLTDNSMADALHRHSELSASDGTPDRALVVDAAGNVGIGTATPASDLSFGGALPTISVDTADTADNKVLFLLGAGAAGITRGSSLLLSGNESFFAGQIGFASGNNANINFSAGTGHIVITIASIPAGDPAVPGVLWRDGTDLKISLG